MKRLLVLICAACWLLAGGVALATDAPVLLDKAKVLAKKGKNKEALGVAAQAVQALTGKIPFHIANVVLAKEKVGGYGIYNPRANNVYPTDNATIHLYLEPKAYKIVNKPKGIYRWGFSVDLYLLKSNGQVISGRESFMKRWSASRHPNRETIIGANLTFKKMAPGKFTIRLVCHDLVSKQTAEVRVPIVIKAGAPVAKKTEKQPEKKPVQKQEKKAKEEVKKSAPPSHMQGD